VSPVAMAPSEPSDDDDDDESTTPAVSSCQQETPPSVSSVANGATGSGAGGMSSDAVASKAAAGGGRGRWGQLKTAVGVASALGGLGSSGLRGGGSAGGEGSGSGSTRGWFARALHAECGPGATSTRCMPFFQAKRIVGRVLEEKVIADAVDDREGTPRTAFAQFVQDWLVTEYGLKAIAFKQLRAIAKTVRTHGDPCAQPPGRGAKQRRAASSPRARPKPAEHRSRPADHDQRLWLFGQLTGMLSTTGDVEQSESSCADDKLRCENLVVDCVGQLYPDHKTISEKLGDGRDQPPMLELRAVKKAFAAAVSRAFPSWNRDPF
jgi:hypothetical protein